MFSYKLMHIFSYCNHFLYISGMNENETDPHIRMWEALRGTVKRRRGEEGMSQGEVARAIGYKDYIPYQSLELGKPPTFEKFCKILELFSIKISFDVPPVSSKSA